MSVRDRERSRAPTRLGAAAELLSEDRPEVKHLFCGAAEPSVLLAAGPVDFVLFGVALTVLMLTVAAGSALRHYRWPRLERLVGPGPKLDALDTDLDDERRILDGLLIVRLIASLVLLLVLAGMQTDHPLAPVAEAPLAFVVQLGWALLLFLIGLYGIVRGLARAAPERTLLLTLTAARAMARAVHPFVVVTESVGRVFARAFGLGDEGPVEEAAREDILDAVTEGERGGAIADEEREMIENIIEVRDQAVSEVMTPRTSVFAIPLDTEVDVAVARVIESGHSRVPVYGSNIDDVKGVLYAKDLLALWAVRGKDLPTLAALIRPPVFIPETKKTSALLEELKAAKVHMAIILDEYGGMAGIITIEDIIEEIVGEIQDEYDSEESESLKSVTKLDDTAAVVPAVLHIDELNETLNTRIPESEGYDTIGGFLFSHMGRVPAEGELLEVDGVCFEILEADERRIHRVKVTAIAT